ncbi:unnamed protein product, partial [Mycena citricolor]
IYINGRKLFVLLDALDTNTCLLLLAYKKIVKGLKKAGLSIDLSKRKLIHYSCRKQDNIAPAIQLLNNNGSTMTITVTPTIKWLEVYLDWKLTFKHHIKTLVAWAMKKLM